MKRRTDVAGISPNEGSIQRLVGAALMEQQDDRTRCPAIYTSLTEPPWKITVLPGKAYKSPMRWPPGAHAA